jgi:flagellum-specific peptidoglycan hydrolase FlgJ
MCKNTRPLPGPKWPATLAQGLLESNAGQSQLAQKTNNHFGIKCFSSRCKKGHCANFSDDTHKDFFVKYNNARESFRAHSNFLKNGKRYQKLWQLNSNDYRAWARGLAKCGYATDKKYAEKVMNIIQSLHLEQFDE